MCRLFRRRKKCLNYFDTHKLTLHLKIKFSDFLLTVFNVKDLEDNSLNDFYC